MISAKMQLSGISLEISGYQSGVNPTRAAAGPVRLNTSYADSQS